MDKNTYLAKRQDALAAGDKGFCVPLAISLVTDQSFATVNRIMVNKGIRKPGDGVYRTDYTRALKNGWFNTDTTEFQIKDVTAETLAAGGRTVRTVARVLRKGRFVVSVKGHCLSVIDGQACDWTDNRLHRVQQVLEIIPVSVAKPEPVVAPKAAPQVAPQSNAAKLPANLRLMDILVNGKGFEQFELRASGKFLRWDTTLGTVLLSGGVRSDKIRLFIRDDATAIRMAGVLETITGDAGQRNARDTSWTLTLAQLVELRSGLWS